jgi:hypothetical protein
VNPRRERAWARAIWSGATLLELGALALVSQAILVRRNPRTAVDDPVPAATPAVTEDGRRSQALAILAEKRMSKAIAKPPAVVSAPPPRPALATLVRLSGIVDYGPKAPSQAIIEFLPGGQSKSYKHGDWIANSGARVARISDAVLLDYDGKLWILGFTGVEESTEAPVMRTGSEEPQ